MTEIAEQRCHWSGGQRITSAHRSACRDAGCAGCKPCEREHCGMPRCSRHLGDYELSVCNRCVGTVRAHLVRIRELCSLAPIAATEHGIHSEAAVLAGPVPEHSTHAARRRWALGGALCRCPEDGCPDRLPMPSGPVCEKADDRKRPCSHHVCKRRTYRPTCPGLADWLEYTDDERHPLWVIGTWDMLVTEHLGHHRTNRVTIESAARYLATNLTDLARDEGFAFDELAREVADCVDHVENVMAVAIRHQRGAPCPVCHASGRKAKPLVREYAEDQADDSLDLWVCPSPECAQTWTIEEYDRYVEREHQDRATALTARQMASQYRVSEGSVRGWASRGDVRRRGRDAQGLTLYDVADTLVMRDKAGQRSA